MTKVGEVIKNVIYAPPGLSSMITCTWLSLQVFGRNLIKINMT